MLAAGLAVAMILQSSAVYAVELTDDVEIVDVEEEGALTDEETEIANDDLVEGIEEIEETPAEEETEIVEEQTERESEESSEFTVESETDIDLEEIDSLETYSTTNDLVYGDYTYTVSNNEAKIKKYRGSEKEIHIPDIINGYKVTEIASRAFMRCETLERVVIPDGVKIIGSFAFSGCISLKEIELPEGLEQLGCAFIRGTMIKSLTIPSTVKEAGGYAGGGATNGATALEEVIFADGMERIPEWVCSSTGNDTLKKISIPESVTEIGASAFLNLTGLKSITFGKEIESIQVSAFQGCSGLEKIEFQKNDRMITDANGVKKLYPVYIGD